MRKLLVTVVVVLALGMPAPAQAHAADPVDAGALATIEQSDQVTSACDPPTTDAHCQQHSFHVDGYSFWGLHLWRMTLTLQLGYNPRYCPCIINRDSIRVTVTPWVDGNLGWEWQGIIDKDHGWCTPHDCYWTYRQGAFHRSYGQGVSTYPWIKMRGYASTRIWDVWSS
jgi:hypothetical protein